MLNLSKFYPWGQRDLAAKATGLASLVALVLMGLPAQASVTLTRAEVEALRNRVELIPRGREARAARMSDFLAVGDALRTAAASQADLRFNDGSLARVGERATFRFVPNTRNFRLTNGTVLLLIPPGQGRTNIQTPSAVTGIQGSAVVVRYVPETDLTLVMALTNNPAGPMTITASNCGPGGADCGSTEYALYGGQMALIQNNQVQVVEFDLPTFYQTSPLVEGLELDNPNAESPLGPALEAVRQETLEALEEQSPFSEAITLNPAFIGMEGTNQLVGEQPWLLSPTEAGVSPLANLNNVLTPGNSLVTSITPPQAAGPLPVRPGAIAPPPSSVGLPSIPPSPGVTPTPIPNPGPTPPITSGPGPLPTPITTDPTPTPITPDPTPTPIPTDPGPAPTDPGPITTPGGDTPDPGSGPGPGTGPGNANPPPFNGEVPANPPAEPGPFLPPDK